LKLKNIVSNLTDKAKNFGAFVAQSFAPRSALAFA